VVVAMRDCCGGYRLVFASMVVVGWAFDRSALERLAIILKTSGRSPTDFNAG